MKWLGLFLLVLMLGTYVNAQEPTPTELSSNSEVPPQLVDVISAEFNTSSLTPLIGEPITMSLAVETPENVLVVAWPEFEEQWGDFVVLSTTERTAETGENGITIYIQTMDLRLWRTGDTRTPETFVTYQSLEDNETFSVPVRPLFFTVPSVLETTDLNQLSLKPYSPLISMFYIPLWVIVGSGVLLIAVGFGIFKWWQKWRSILGRHHEESIPPLERILNLLSAIPSKSITPLEAYSLIVNELRQYLAHTYAEITLDMIHEEIIEHLSQNQHSDQLQLDDLRRILDQGTLVKYASVMPSEQNTERLIEVTRRWLSETQELETSE